MVEAFSTALTVAEELRRRFEEDGDNTTLRDGTVATLEPNHYGGYVISSVENDDDGPIWSVTADHSEMDMLNPPATLIVHGGEDMYFMSKSEEAVPEWTLPILQNIVTVEEIRG